MAGIAIGFEAARRQGRGVNWGEVEWMRQASRRRRYLVGVSGGADSVALLRGLVAAGFRRLIVVHLDHGLRGAQARGDAAWVGRLAARLGLACEAERVDVGRLAEQRQVSLETAGRQARHEFFDRCGRKWHCRRVLLGHHADDQAETVLWNLLRGSRGAVGMEVTQSVVVGGRRLDLIRPLLGVRRADLRGWLRAGGWAWREDTTNGEPVAVRNRLRHEGLPLLTEIAQRDVVPLLARAAAAGREQAEIEAWACGEAAVRDPQGRLHVPRLRELPEALQRACLFAYLREAGVPDLDRSAVERVQGLLVPGGSARVTLAGGRTVRRRQGRIFVEAVGSPGKVTKPRSTA